MKKNKEEVVDTTNIEENDVLLEKDAEIVKLQEENKVLNDKILRLSAEMQNLSRRTSEEVSKMLKYEGEGFITKTIEVIDILERAIKLDDTNLEDELSKFLDGFKMIYSKFLAVLDSYEIKEIECLNKPFDHNTMEAVMTEVVEGVEPNTVVDVMQKGYMYKDKVIRYAMVRVSE